MSVIQRVNNMTKPMSKLRFVNIAPIIANGLSTATNKSRSFISDDQNKVPEKKSFMDFVRMYKIGNIPIMDFIITYILLYIINKLYIDIDNKYIIIGTIPITLVIDLILDDDVTPSVMIVAIIIISSFYLLANVSKKKNNTYI